MTTETVWLRLYREGNTIPGEYALDEAGEPGEWVAHPGTRPVDTTPPREGEGVQLGLLAGADIEGPPFEQLARFDFARFEPDDDIGNCPEEDTTPPETTHALPAQPGEGGTYDGPVDVTLSATDPAGDGGEPVTHDVQAQPAGWDPDQLRWPPATRSPGTSGGAGAFQHDVWLVPPGGDPDPTGGDIFEVTDGTVPPGGPPVSFTLSRREPGPTSAACTPGSRVARGPGWWAPPR